MFFSEFRYKFTYLECLQQKIIYLMLPICYHHYTNWCSWLIDVVRMINNNHKIEIFQTSKKEKQKIK